MKKFFLKYKEQLIKAIVIAIVIWPVNELLNYISSKINYNKIFDIIISLLRFKINLSIQFLLLVLIVSMFIAKIYKKYKNNILRQSGLFILSAKYGAKGKYIDIKNELNNRIKDGKLEVVLDNYIAGDPITGERKECLVQYQYNGERTEKKYNEFEIIKLPE